MFKLKLNRKAQVAPFLIIIIVIIILAIAATMLIGEAGFSRLRLSNISDGALFTSASGLCRSLNQIRAISFGSGGLMVTWTGLQSYLLAAHSKCVCVGDWDKLGWAPGQDMFPVWQYLGQPVTTGQVINTYESIYKLHDQAEDIANRAPKDLREGIYNGILGGGLIDEAKPFLESEVTRDPQGRIISLNYDAYLKRDYPYQEALRTLKTTDSSWYNNNQISYSFNKKGFEAVAQPGILETGVPSNDYGSYLNTNLNDVPNNIDIDYQSLPLLYFYQKAINDVCYTEKGVPFFCCHCIMLPGFLVDPYAWISEINIGSSSFGTDTTKKLDFRALPFFAGQPVVEHKNKVRIKGSVWSGYDFGLEE